MGRRSVTKPFAGFPALTEGTTLPNLFFSAVLPEVTTVEELVVSLYFFFALGRKKAKPRAISFVELSEDRTLIRTLGNFGDDPHCLLTAGLRLATERGTLLRYCDKTEAVRYLLNTPEHRRTMLSHDEMAMGSSMESHGSSTVEVQRDDVLALLSQLYESNIGTITPLIAEELKEAAERYQARPKWVEAAFREAAKANVRNWKYIQRILERWELEGPAYGGLGGDPESSSGSTRPLSGRYRHLFRR